MLSINKELLTVYESVLIQYQQYVLLFSIGSAFFYYLSPGQILTYPDRSWRSAEDDLRSLTALNRSRIREAVVIRPLWSTGASRINTK